MVKDPIRILIADSDEDDVFLIKDMMLEGWPGDAPQVDWAASSERALSLISSNPYHLCFIDLRLDGDDGFALLRRVRKRGYDIPVLFMCAGGDARLADEARSIGALDCLQKRSLSTDVLKHSIEGALGPIVPATPAEGEAADRILDAGVAEAAQLLRSLNDHGAGITEALAILCRALNMESVHVFQHIENPRGSHACIPWFVWGSEGEHGCLELGMALSYGELGIEAGCSALQDHRWVHQDGSGLSATQRRFFGGDIVKSLTLVPIFLDEVFWGFLVFGDRQAARDWPSETTDRLQELAARLGDEIRRYRDEATFRSIVESTASQVGDDFFRSLVRHLALALPADHVYVSEVVNARHSQCNILAGWENGTFISQQTFKATNNPSEEVLAGMMSVHPDHVRDDYPGDPFLARLNARCYAGVPCFDAAFKVVGLLFVMDDQPLVDQQRTLSILKVFAARAGAELERKRTEGKIRNLAYHDALTGLPNRVLLNDRLEMALANSRRNQNKLAVLFVDFDGFKQINDTLGHALGDQLLKGVAERLRQCLRKQDTVARLGGDEFVVLLPEVGAAADAGNLARKLLSVVRAPFDLGGHKVSITLSIGVAIYPRDGESSKSLLQHADEALYLAKSGGKDSYSYYEPERGGEEE
jgi:diguanylate cyclase (GGDEF)-like protein